MLKRKNGSKTQQQENEGDSLEEHPDYKRNLWWALQFVDFVKPMCLPGMRCYIGCNEKGQKAIVWITFQNPVKEDGEGYLYEIGKHTVTNAIPISMHQLSYDFDRECKSNILGLKKRIENINHPIFKEW